MWNSSAKWNLYPSVWNLALISQQFEFQVEFEKLEFLIDSSGLDILISKVPDVTVLSLRHQLYQKSISTLSFKLVLTLLLPKLFKKARFYTIPVPLLYLWSTSMKFDQSYNFKFLVYPFTLSQPAPETPMRLGRHFAAVSLIYLWAVRHPWITL